MAHSCMAIQSPTPRCPSPSTAVSSYSTAPDCSSVFSPIKPLVSRRTPRLRHHEYNGTCYAVKAVHSERSGAPGTAARRGFSSPRDNMVAPSSNFRVEAKAPVPSPMVTEGFGSVITQLFQYRIIRCGGAVDEDMANLIVGQLLYLDSVDPNKDIVMYINCPGGSVTAGMAIFDAMKHIRPNVSTVCVGLAASMGSFLLSAGTKGKRYSLPNSRIMIHQPLGGAQGTETDIGIQTNEMQHHKANLSGYLALHTGQSLEKIYQDTDRDFFMSPKEAVEYGLIDGIILNPFKALPSLAVPLADQSSS